MNQEEEEHGNKTEKEENNTTTNTSEGLSLAQQFTRSMDPDYYKERVEGKNESVFSGECNTHCPRHGGNGEPSEDECHDTICPGLWGCVSKGHNGAAGNWTKLVACMHKLFGPKEAKLEEEVEEDMTKEDKTAAEEGGKAEGDKMNQEEEEHGNKTEKEENNTTTNTSVGLSLAQQFTRSMDPDYYAE